MVKIVPLQSGCSRERHITVSLCSKGHHVTPVCHMLSKIVPHLAVCSAHAVANARPGLYAVVRRAVSSFRLTLSHVRTMSSGGLLASLIHAFRQLYVVQLGSVSRHADRSSFASQIELGFFRASLALTVYEYLLTFEQEHTLIWKRKWTGSTWLFLINRYCLLITELIQVAQTQKVRLDMRS